MTAHPAETVEVTSSYARRARGVVRLVLHLPEVRVGDSSEGRVRLSGRSAVVRAPATVTPAEPGVLVEATVPARRLPPDVWRIAVRPGPEGVFRRVQARLLTSRTQPIALLVGPAPRTRMSPSAPAAAERPRSGVAGLGRVAGEVFAVLQPGARARLAGALRRGTSRLRR